MDMCWKFQLEMLVFHLTTVDSTWKRDNTCWELFGYQTFLVTWARKPGFLSYSCKLYAQWNSWLRSILMITLLIQIRSRIGYCPQDDPVLNHMTGQEVLIMYARLRGVPEPDISKYVETFLYAVQLEANADDFVHIYRSDIMLLQLSCLLVFLLFRMKACKLNPIHLSHRGNDCETV